MTTFNSASHINFLEKLPKDFKEFMKTQFDLNCSTVCFKPDENGSLSEDAKIVMVAYKAWEVKSAECNMHLLRALNAEKQLETVTKPDCFWNDDDEDGMTYSTLGELLESTKDGEFFTLLNVGRSVQIDNVLLVVDHHKKSFVVVDDVKDGKKVLAMKNMRLNAQSKPFNLNSLIPEGVARTKGKSKKMEKF